MNLLSLCSLHEINNLPLWVMMNSTHSSNIKKEKTTNTDDALPVSSSFIFGFFEQNSRELTVNTEMLIWYFWKKNLNQPISQLYDHKNLSKTPPGWEKYLKWKLIFKGLSHSILGPVIPVLYAFMLSLGLLGNRENNNSLCISSDIDLSSNEVVLVCVLFSLTLAVICRSLSFLREVKIKYVIFVVFCILF